MTDTFSHVSNMYSSQYGYIILMANVFPHAGELVPSFVRVLK